MGGLLIIYTVSGGAKAVAYTQQVQLIIVLIAMFMAGYMVVHLMPEDVGFLDALHVGGKLGKLNVITSGNEKSHFNWNDRYNIWSGIIGGFFLALSYFGTDQSQVGRYLTAQNNTESRLGLLMNGLIKIPLQFFILLIGVLVFSFYQFQAAPISFNSSLITDAKASVFKDSVNVLQHQYDVVNRKKQQTAKEFTQALKNGKEHSLDILTAELKMLNETSNIYRNQFKIISSKISNKDTNDTNYIFLGFVKEFLPPGLKGLLIAIVFLAAWGSIAAALNSLAASTLIDFHQRISTTEKPFNEYNLSKWYTLAWGLFCIFVAQFANKLGQSLIEAVNVLGSLFYGVILGIFLTAFYVKRVGGHATFWSALIIECFILLLFFNEGIPFLSFLPDISFLWMNAIGAIGVVILGLFLQIAINPMKK
jgi:Na+/proline symporter